MLNRFKLSKTSLMLLGAGVLVILFVALFLSYSSNVQQRDSLLQTIQTAQQQIPQVSTQKQTLQPQLNQLQDKISGLKASYDTASANFKVTSSVESIEYDEALSSLADDSSVTISKIVVSDSVDEKEGNLTFTTFNIEVDVAGDRTNILDFIHRVMQSDYFTSASVNTVDFKDDSAATPVPTPVPTPTVELTITVYKYKGS